VSKSELVPFLNRSSLLAAGLLAAATGRAAAVSPLLARGYTVMPEPQAVSLRCRDFLFVQDYRLELAGVPRDDVAVETLTSDLASRAHLAVREGSGNTIRLAIAPGSVAIGEAADRDKTALARQAYRIELKPGAVRIAANAAPGLLYGVETLVDLLGGGPRLPEGEIVDWPDLQYRVIYWDDAHHLDRPEVLKRAVRQAAFFKLNAFAIKLEGHFQYRSAPALVEPYALSPTQLQELTDYGLRYHVQVIPYLDSPAHIAFILKHPEYAGLREYPQSNYELCVTNPDSYKLLFGMFDDLLAANKGVNYFYLSTDEPYYIGLADNSQCHEAARAREVGSVGKLLAEFLDKAAGYLHDCGRTVIFWGEYPLKPGDILSLPNHLVNGETYGPEFDPLFKAHGIRSMIYTSTEGEEKLFPNYFILPASKRLHPGRPAAPRVEGTFESISFSPARRQADLIGVVNAGWADMGVHPETFWLGYATAGSAAWHPGSPDPRESMASFYPLFYGPRVSEMHRVYQLMSEQAQFWTDSWDTAPSAARKPIFGNSNQIYEKPQLARDQVLPLPPVPSPDNLAFQSTWAEDNRKRLELAVQFLSQNDELLGLLYSNLPRAEFNRYNLEVFASIALLCRHNLAMLRELGEIHSLLENAQAAAHKNDARRAVAMLDQALDKAQRIKAERDRALQGTVATWYKSWFPRVAEANARRFLHELDDVKDHLPDRTVGMSFLVYRELLLPFGDWAGKLAASRNKYARRNNLPVREFELNWEQM